MKKIFLALVFLLLFLTPFSFAQEEDKLTKLKKQIEELETKISEAKDREKTLSSQISYMDSQIKLTGLRINKTIQEIERLEVEIASLSGKIDRLEQSLTTVSEILLNRIVKTYKTGRISPLYFLFSSEGFSGLLRRAKYIKIVQAHDKKLMIQMQTTKDNFAAQKELREEKKEERESLKRRLESQEKILAQQKKDKEHLLEVTRNDERRYQELLSQTRAELEAIQAIIAGKGEETKVKEVEEGERIATFITGPSVCSTGSHLHFEIREKGEVRNPFSYLKNIEMVDDSSGDPFNPTGNWQWPLTPPIKFHQGFGGNTWAIRTGIVWYKFHTGIDISSEDKAVKAVRKGVLYQGGIACGGGTLRYVKVDHKDEDIDTYYLHVNY